MQTALIQFPCDSFWQRLDQPNGRGSRAITHSRMFSSAATCAVSTFGTVMLPGGACPPVSPMSCSPLQPQAPQPAGRAPPRHCYGVAPMGVGAHGSTTAATPDTPRNGTVTGPAVVPDVKGTGSRHQTTSHPRSCPETCGEPESGSSNDCPPRPYPPSCALRQLRSPAFLRRARLFTTPSAASGHHP